MCQNNRIIFLHFIILDNLSLVSSIRVMWISSTDSLNLLDNIINKAKSKDKDTIQSKHKFRSECNCTILLDRTI